MISSHPSKRPSRRRHPRNPVQVTVHWHNRLEEAVAAELHDVSAEGVFLVPQGRMPDAIQAGDTVWVVVPSAREPETLAGTVRWTGFHPSHKLPGFGIQLDHASSDAIARLFPVVHGE